MSEKKAFDQSTTPSSDAAGELGDICALSRRPIVGLGTFGKPCSKRWGDGTGPARWTSMGRTGKYIQQEGDTDFNWISPCLSSFSADIRPPCSRFRIGPANQKYKYYIGFSVSSEKREGPATN